MKKRYIISFLGFLLLMSAVCLKSAITYKGSLRDGERYIVVIIPSFNNEKWCTLNIESVLRQKYRNFHVVFINDCSTDATFRLVSLHCQNRGMMDKVTLINNSERKGALYNIYHAIHACDDHAIIITLDGDDWFKGDDVLTTINNAYNDPNVWLTYGQFEEYPRGSLGICHPMPDYIVASRSYRKQPWFTSHLRTFYAGLFKKVKREDMLDEDNNFYQVTWDQSFMFPMLEMADGHIKFIDKILYVYNQANPLNDFKQHIRKQLNCEQIIRRKPQYDPITVAEAEKLFVVPETRV